MKLLLPIGLYKRDDEYTYQKCFKIDKKKQKNTVHCKLRVHYLLLHHYI